MSRVVAIAGAAGILGGELLRMLEESAFGVGELRPLADALELEPQAGSTDSTEGPADDAKTDVGPKLHVDFLDEEIPLRVASPESFDGCDVVFLAGTPEQAGRLAKLSFLKAACTIDLSGRFAGDEDVPLILPGVNDQDVAALPKRTLVAVPDAATAIVALALAPLHRVAGLKFVTVTTFEAASGMGRAGMDELGRQIRELFNYRSIDPRIFPKPIAFNCIPQVDAFEATGYTRAETALGRGVARVLAVMEGSPVVHATRVWVPVFSGHSASITIETERPLSVADARAALAEAEGVEVLDDPAEGDYPVNGDTVGGDTVVVGRLRQDGERRLTLWVAADNLRRGAATAAVRLAEAILSR